jgi:hypothetical protein
MACGLLTKCILWETQGSAFIGYGIILAIALLAGEAWVKRTGRSQEWWDSCVITAWVSLIDFGKLRSSLTTPILHRVLVSNHEESTRVW